MAVNIALEIKTIPGESKIDGHENWIDVKSYTWGMSQTGTFHTGHGGGAGKVKVEDLTIEKLVDASTPALMRHCCDGKHIPEMQLVVRKQGGDQLDYIIIKMQKVMVTLVEPSGVTDLDAVGETVRFNFASYTIKYTKQTDDGAAGEQFEQGWDMEKNAATA